MNLRTLEYFVVLADELNFSHAAERLHIAQPALSQQIRGLERRLGTELVDRNHRPLRLTEAGNYLLAAGREILTSCEEATVGTREVGRGIRGWLSIGFTRSSMYSVLPPALKTFHRRFPQVELRLSEMVTEEQADALRDGRIQVGIGRQPAEIDGFRSRRLLSEPVVIVISADEPASEQDSIAITDIADLPLILYPKTPSARFAGFIESLYSDQGLASPARYRTHEIQTAIGLVAAGLGITFVGVSVARHGRSDVVYRPVSGNPASSLSTLDATWPEGDTSSHVAAFLACFDPAEQAL